MSPNRPMDYFWVVMTQCDCRCPYCIYGLYPLDRRKVGYFYTAEEWLAGWERMYKKYGEGRIVLTGGEPTLYPGFTDLAVQLSRWYQINIDTNFQLPSAELELLLKRLSPRRVDFSTSFHPFMAKTDEFIAKIHLLKRNGFNYLCRLVAFPPLVEKIPAWRKTFGDEDIILFVNPFSGEWNGRKYPESYTPAEKEIIFGQKNSRESARIHPADKEFVRQMLNMESPRGRPCRTGSEHVRVEDNGWVYRCVSYAAMEREPLGNFIKDDIVLWDRPRVCEADACEWEYRYLVDETDRFKSDKVLRDATTRGGV
ncbi:MAG TPA: radical SAM protein [Elusimicrobiota bacterium]|nr:radical SAM protein [Elusimicrobiota bacterium]